MSMRLKKHMKILIITEFFPQDTTAMSGGVEARAFHIVNELQRFGHNVAVVSRTRSYIAATPLSLFPRLWYQLEAIVKGFRFKADVVEGSNFVSYLPAFITARLTNARAISWFADVYGKTWFSTMSWPVALSGYLLEWISLKLPWDRVIAMSEVTRHKLINAGIPEAKIAVVYGGVDLTLIEALKAHKYDKPTICTAARLVPYKHIDDLIQALAIVQQTIPEAQLMILGDGPEKLRLHKLSNNITIDNSVHFLGSLPQEDVWRTMKRSHVFCLPSTVEGFGLVTIEAMACGLPFVNTDIPVNREITQNGKGGYLYEPRNVRQLADLLLKTLNTQQPSASQALIKKYTWSKICQDTLTVYGL
jgi:glycosyltransferase involved in cell wall biosynthesis